MTKKLEPVKFIQRGNVTAETVIRNITDNNTEYNYLDSLDFKRVCVCASGPSLKEHLPEITDLVRNKGFSLASMNGSLKYLFENNLTPDYHFQVDARKGMNLDFYNNCIPSQTNFIISTQCDPEIFDKLTAYGKVTRWQIDNYSGAQDAIRGTIDNPTIFGGSPNVGHASLKALTALGYRFMYLYGYDGSYEGGARHAFKQDQNKNDEKVEIVFQERKYYTSPTMAHDAQKFPHTHDLIGMQGVHIEMRSKGLLPDILEWHKAEKEKAARCKIQSLPPEINETNEESEEYETAKPLENLEPTFILWKWKGHIPYTAQDVETTAAMIERNTSLDHKIICITDDATGLDKSIEAIDIESFGFSDMFNQGHDWHRLSIFSAKMSKLGDFLCSIDLDNVITGNIDAILQEASRYNFTALKDPYYPHQFCTAFHTVTYDYLMAVHIYQDFMSNMDQRVEEVLTARRHGKYIGYDQALISMRIKEWGFEKYTTAFCRPHGMYSFRRDFVGDNAIITDDLSKPLPENAKMINFHGKYNPKDDIVRRVYPWVDQHYRI